MSNEKKTLDKTEGKTVHNEQFIQNSKHMMRNTTNVLRIKEKY